jgi:hypothetical protein
VFSHCPAFWWPPAGWLRNCWSSAHKRSRQWGPLGCDPPFGSTPIQIHFASMQGGSRWTNPPDSAIPLVTVPSCVPTNLPLSSAYPSGLWCFQIALRTIHYLIALPAPLPAALLTVFLPQTLLVFCLPAFPTTTTRFPESPSSRRREGDDTQGEREKTGREARKLRPYRR